jgi:septum formation protein
MEILMNKLILASGSPRRRRILEQAGLRFRVEQSPYEEGALEESAPEGLAIRHSALKAEAVSLLHPDAVVLAADTIVVLDDEIMGKPENEAHARRMLASLSGREHRVITGFTVAHESAGRLVSRAEVSLVRFRTLTENEIAEYVSTGEPLDKAGSYGIQGEGGALVESVDGDYLNVVGLPLDEVLQVLEGFGILPEK